jgi:hypothetical protein
MLGCFALGDDFTTSDGKEYKDATVRRVEADGIVIITKSGGLAKLYFAELPKKFRRNTPCPWKLTTQRFRNGNPKYSSN